MKEIDWEERRFLIAKNVLSSIIEQQDNKFAYHFESGACVPDGATVRRIGDTLVVRPSKRKEPKGNVCRQCRWWGEGHATATPRLTMVCKLAPKRYRWGDTIIYYHRVPLHQACEHFEPK